MNKPAKTKYGIHPLLESRWSPRFFSEKIVEKEKLQRIFEAAQWSPSCSNEQPWRFILGEKGTDTYDKIFNGLTDGNKVWANLAAVLVISIAKKHFTGSERTNFHCLYDTGQSAAHLTFQATHEGLFVHQMAGFHAGIMRESFNIPDEFEVVSAIAIGYPGNPDIINEDEKQRAMAERKRRDLNETVFSGSFGEPSEL